MNLYKVSAGIWSEDAGVYLRSDDKRVVAESLMEAVQIALERLPVDYEVIAVVHVEHNIYMRG